VHYHITGELCKFLNVSDSIPYISQVCNNAKHRQKTNNLSIGFVAIMRPERNRKDLEEVKGVQYFINKHARNAFHRHFDHALSKLLS
jgi:hypothetical protein